VSRIEWFPPKWSLDGAPSGALLDVASNVSTITFPWVHLGAKWLQEQCFSMLD